ncbi:MAG: hypothetical protein AAFY39_09200, partial [Pseudomonadota bacterium]
EGRASTPISSNERTGFEIPCARINVVTNARRRRFVKTLMRAQGISNPVLSFEEIGVDARPSLVGVVAA